MNFVKRIPRFEQIAPVYAVIVLMIFSWSLRSFLWRLPSWIYFSTVGEIAVILAYMVVVNLVDTILVLVVPVVISVILPQKWFHDRFVTKGTSLVLLGLGSLMYFNKDLQAESLFSLFQRVLPVVMAILVLVFLIDRVAFLRRVLEELANRAIIFLYISIPVCAISLLTVLIRNIF